jgi:hypothetical protein
MYKLKKFKFCNGSAMAPPRLLQWLCNGFAMAATAPFLLIAVNPVNTPVAMALQWFCNGSPTVFYNDGATSFNLAIEL